LNKPSNQAARECTGFGIAPERTANFREKYISPKDKTTPQSDILDARFIGPGPAARLGQM
jgi:hypothetical protein